MKAFNIVVFDGFETLDAMGPAEIIGLLPDTYNLQLVSPEGGMILSAQNLCVDTADFSAVRPGGVLLIPGGIGTRALVANDRMIQQIKALATDADYVLTVCTGATVLAKTGLLDGRAATSNKRLFSWAQSISFDVRWQKKARWVADGKFYTSSGVTAGMDMTLGFIRDTTGIDTARSIANHIEYQWNEDPGHDPFAV